MNIIFERLNNYEILLKWDNPDKKITIIDILSVAVSGAILDNRIAETTRDRYIIRHDTFSKPTYRLTCGHQTSIVSERVLPLEGANNFRDAGGYETENGMMVRWGKLYRSDHLHRLTNNDFLYLAPLGIRTIIDYRTAEEIARQPNHLWTEDVKCVCLTPNASSAELAATTSGDAEKVDLLLRLATRAESGVIINSAGKIMEDQYREFIHHPDSVKAFRNMLLLLAQTGEWAVNQHCRGGKDRTGFGIALVHLALGVKKEFIYQDYMLTNQLRAERNRRRMLQYREQTKNEDVLGFLSSMMETRHSYLDASLDEIEKQYGGVERYIYDGLKIMPPTIEKLKARFLSNKKVSPFK
ncbi:tyrosine-protein phosphatase [Erwinia psidii]|uniref:Tyrosine-protein phosphatase n=1 Tax=Erwinia psidii TaxID=69224 RepID=A0A3N6SCD9_9GAMM|nr:tyrosine-protein phosphatase [Erwinia psidii]MCX8958617.1 tyrosine-protein phosphatase [Erwinia psidii]RQM39040.1 tyrosine-protein phosphatase [Erwinia psidii]